MTDELTRAELSALARAAVPDWLTQRIHQQIAAAEAARYAPLSVAAAEQLLPAIAERVTTTPAAPLDALTGRFFATLGQTAELATAFAILCYILPS